MWIFVAAGSSFLLIKKIIVMLFGEKYFAKALKLLHRIWDEYKPSWDTISFSGLDYTMANVTSRKHDC